MEKEAGTYDELPGIGHNCEDVHDAGSPKYDAHRNVEALAQFPGLSTLA